MFAAKDTLLTRPSGGYQISRSLRFNSADSAYLTRTPASAGNRKTYTISVWCKRATTEGTGTIISARTGAPWTFFGFSNGDGVGTNPSLQFSVTAGISPGVYTNAVFRDLSAWYHIVLAVDTTQATASNRVKIYINSVLQDLTSGNYPTLNQDTEINNTIAHEIGNPTGYSSDSNFYLTEYNFINGQALTPSSFGSTNADTGVWGPKKYSGSYGTNGFYLNFSDNSNTTAATLGKDYSGNGNNWTPNNFSVTAGAGNDSLVDVPTSFGTDTGVGGEVRGNYATLNPLQGTGITADFYTANGNLDLNVTNNSGYRNVASTFSPEGFKGYCEITMATATNFFAGFAFESLPPTNVQYQSTGTFIIGDAGNVKDGPSTITGSYTPAISSGDILQIAFDFTGGARNVWFGRNGTWGTTASGLGVPSTGTNPVLTVLNITQAARFYFGINTGGGTVTINANFGQRAFTYTAPSGFKALCTQNLPTPTIGATTATQAGKYFNPVIYTGNGGTQSVTGVGFQPDFTWVKRRDSTNGNGFEDAVRGAGQTLESNNTSAEVGYSAYFTAFTSDGFNMALGGGFFNANAGTYVAWNWRASNATAVSNTAGTITSQVSASTISGFSIVTYTGQSGAGTVGHGLGVAPSMIIVKSRSNGAYGWAVWHSTFTQSEYLLMETTDVKGTASNYWNSSAPSTWTSAFGVGAGPKYVNNSGDTFVAYCFAQIAGYSAFGSYTGNGSTDGAFIYTGFRPAYVMLKRSSAIENWIILDSLRGPYNVNKPYLLANSTASEGSIYSIMDFTSNGFKLRDGDQSWNGSGTYIYMAFASNPFKYSLAR